MFGPRTIRFLVFAALLSILTLVGVSNAETADVVVISGSVTEAFEIETEDGVLLGIEPNAQGSELFFNHVGRLVEVTGTLSGDEGHQVIAIESFRFLDE